MKEDDSNHVDGSSSSNSSSSSSGTTTPKIIQKNNNWEPILNMDNRAPSSECVKRVRSDLKFLLRDPLPGIYCVPDEHFNTGCLQYLYDRKVTLIL
jgi:hypothetical protein